MSFRRHLRQTAKVRDTTPGAADTEGNWTAASQATRVYPCRFELIDAQASPTARSGETFDAGADQVVSVGRLFLPGTALIDARCEVDVDGVPYDVEGEPVPMVTPRGVHHIEARLRRVTR